MQLTYPTPVPDAYSNFLLKLTHEALNIESDFELTQTVKAEYYTNEAGAFGLSAAEHFAADTTLSDDEKARLTRQYQPFFRTASTRGYMVDPATGEIVPPNEDGTYPEGAVPEKTLWLTVLADNVPGETLAEKVSALIIQSIGTMVANRRF
jgi:hypothetical protein